MWVTALIATVIIVAVVTWILLSCTDNSQVACGVIVLMAFAGALMCVMIDRQNTITEEVKCDRAHGVLITQPESSTPHERVCVERDSLKPLLLERAYP